MRTGRRMVAPRRRAAASAARADGVRAVVLGENVFGNLRVPCMDFKRYGRIVALGKHAHAKVDEGDTVALYFV